MDREKTPKLYHRGFKRKNDKENDSASSVYDHVWPENPLKKHTSIEYHQLTPRGKNRPSRDDRDIDEVVIRWQGMSPNGTLRKILRQRGKSAGPLVSQKPGDLNNSPIRGIVQQIIDMRNVDGPDVEIVQKAGFGNNGCSLEASSSVDPTPIFPPTPVKPTTIKAIPRPLVSSKSENPFDKRQLLSSLLIDNDVERQRSFYNDNSNIEIASGQNTLNKMTKNMKSPIKPGTPVAEYISEKKTKDGIERTLSQPDIRTETTTIDSRDSEDVFDDFDEETPEQLAEIERIMQQYETEPPSEQHNSTYERCLVLQVTDGWWTQTNNNVEQSTIGARLQKIVRVFSDTISKERTLLLRDMWLDSDIDVGNYLNLIGLNVDTNDSDVVVGSAKDDPLVVLHPDILISSSHLADVFSCPRRAVLRDRTREIAEHGPASLLMLHGSLVHSLFQTCAMQNRWDDKTISETIGLLISNSLMRLWECNTDEESVCDHILEFKPIFQEWAEKYIHNSSAQGSRFTTYRETQSESMEDKTLAISKIFDMEENIWSPKFGIKGKVDLTVQSCYSNGPTLVEPLELKTGKNTRNLQHHAQLTLYTLLLSDRYSVDVKTGILYYPRSGEMLRIRCQDNELRSIIAARNQITAFLSYSEQTSRSLPDIINNEFICKYCSFRPICYITHKALEDGDEKTANISQELWKTEVSHLTSSHCDFLRLWMGLIDREESDMNRFRSELWTMRSDIRESTTGRCLSDMHFDVDSFVDTHSIDSPHRYLQTFVASKKESIRKSLLESQLSTGDPIIISSEKGHYAFAVGYVHSIDHTRIVLATDRPVRGIPVRLQGFDKNDFQDFESLVEIQKNPRVRNSEETRLYPPVSKSAANETFRIDKDEMSNGISRVRSNLMKLFVSGGSGDPKRRKLIVDLEPPLFLPINPDADKELASVQRSGVLNSGQVTVLRKVLAAQDYALVMGMPGTGKTTTIAQLVKILVSLGKTVLLASYTHLAVDNILLKLKEHKVPMIRLGNKSKVHPGIVEFLSSDRDLRTVKEIDDYLCKTPVVATTCLGISNPIFTRRKFDYCIVDEASQITLPICIGPLLTSSTFVLVGDHHQLPPLVRNTSARDDGLGISLFKRLCEAHPSAVVRLEYQYRMNSDIQKLSSSIIYDGHLRCGTLKISTQKLSFKTPLDVGLKSMWPNPDNTGYLPQMSWVSDALNPAHGAVFLDTDGIPGYEYRSDNNDLVQNNTEIKIIKILTDILQECGIDSRKIGILSPYRAQLRQFEIEYGLRTDDRKAHISNNCGDENQELIEQNTTKVPSLRSSQNRCIEMHTIDRYQGRDTDVVIISWVRSNLHRAIGDLLRDWHRINVAITRARLKLVMVGSSSTLTRSPLFAEMLRILSASNGIIKLNKSSIPHTEPDKTTNINSICNGSSRTRTARSSILKDRRIISNIMDGL